MPSALTMLNGYRAQLAGRTGAGMAGLNLRARLGGTIGALERLVDEEHDPRRPLRGEGGE